MAKTSFQEYFVPIGFVAFVVVLLAFFGDFVQSLNWIVQYLFIGAPLAVVIFYYFEKSEKRSIKGHIAGLFFMATAWDLVMPPFAISPQGIIASQQALFLTGTSIDYFIGSLLQLIGFNGIVLFFATYLGFFAILYVGGKIIAEKF